MYNPYAIQQQQPAVLDSETQQQPERRAAAAAAPDDNDDDSLYFINPLFIVFMGRRTDVARKVSKTRVLAA